MWKLILKILAYFFGAVGAVSLVMGVILRLSRGPKGAFFFGIRPPAFLDLSQVCLLFAIGLGIAALLEKRVEKEEVEGPQE
ncbi:MAG: hypothetical protein U9R03_02795 [Candidatus Aerophobetes bacterium]|nr:hypothetical protein [Candidatus Aerophobetes bacterium]